MMQLGIHLQALHYERVVDIESQLYHEEEITNYLSKTCFHLFFMLHCQNAIFSNIYT